MKEYIEKAVSLNALSKSGVTCNMRAHKIVAAIPAADVVEVVRCKDCIHLGFCGEATNLEVMGFYGFCSRGQRKEGDHD